MEISTSLLNVKEENAIQKFFELEIAKTDYFQIDVMDGKFVENNTVERMEKYAEYLSHTVLTPLEMHLMVEDVKKYVDDFSIFSPVLISFHYEACKSKEEVIENINYIREKDIKVGLAINPETKLDEIAEFLSKINVLLVMSVKPGAGGQKFIETSIEKIRQAKAKIEELGLETEIEVDGGVTLENIAQIKEAGADIAVAGTTILNSTDYARTIQQMKE